MLDRIPEVMRNAHAWTVSGGSKIPLDPHSLFESNRVKGYSPSTDKLMPLDPILTYIEEMKNPDLKAAIQLTRDIPYIIVDIEPEGMIENNPYFKWPYIYLEYSRNHGLHGILPFNPPEEYDYLKDKFMIKDEIWETEVLVSNGHFATFTFNEQPLNQYEGRVKYANSEKFQKQLAQHLAERTTKDTIIHGDAELSKDSIQGLFGDLIDEPIHPSDQKHIDSVLDEVEPLSLHPSDDASLLEYRKMLQIYGKLIHKQPAFLSEGAIAKRTIPVMWHIMDHLIDTRPKHYSQRNSQAYGKVPWLGYTMLSAIEYIRNQSLEDSYLGPWVTKN